MSSKAVEKASHFVKNEKQFHLGVLPSECPHPKTVGLAEKFQDDPLTGVKMLQSVDRDIPPVAKEILEGEEFAKLVSSMVKALKDGKKIIFTGCGATGRLSILLEAMWRRWWRNSRKLWEGEMPDMTDKVLSVMAGGDYALVKSVEAYEDFTDFGKHQLLETGIEAEDVLVAITEGGETSFVIGTANEALAQGAKVFFVFNNPAEILAKYIERSRGVIENPEITKLDLATGPMAVAGSTRMQATTSELLITGAALELALEQILREKLPPAKLAEMQISVSTKNFMEYCEKFESMLDTLEKPESVEALTELTLFENEIYSRSGRITYAGDKYLLDIFTDTTERAPTFMLPPFKKHDDPDAPPSWAFVKDPARSTHEAWCEAFQRNPRCLNWDKSTYQELNAPLRFQENPPSLDKNELHRFLIGSENDPSRHESEVNSAILVAIGDETSTFNAPGSKFKKNFSDFSKPFEKCAAISVGKTKIESKDDIFESVFHIDYEAPPSLLDLWGHLVVKLVLNTISTCTMAKMGRMKSNWMAHVETTNKKLVDRGTRLIAELCEMEYFEACVSLHETLEELERIVKPGDERPSPVWWTVSRIMKSKNKSL